MAVFDPVSLDVLHYADTETCWGIAPDVLTLPDGHFAVASYEVKCVAVSGPERRLYVAGAGLPRRPA